MTRGTLRGSRWLTGRLMLRAAGLAMAVVLSVSVAVVLYFYLLAMPKATVAGAVTVSLYLVLAPWALWLGAMWIGRATGEVARFVGEVVRSSEVKRSG